MNEHQGIVEAMVGTLPDDVQPTKAAVATALVVEGYPGHLVGEHLDAVMARLEELRSGVSAGAMFSYFGLTSPGEALGGIGLAAQWASIAAVWAFWPDEAMAQDGAVGAYQSWPTEWLILTTLVSFGGYAVWRIVEAARECRAIYRQYADATDDDLNEMFDDPGVYFDPPTDELSEFEGSDAEDYDRCTRHWVVSDGMLVASMERGALATLFPSLFPYPV